MDEALSYYTPRAPTSPFVDADFTGKVVEVFDGDTFAILHNGETRRIRLNGVICPEMNQQDGYKAKRFTSKLILGKKVGVEKYGADKYGRTVADVILQDGTNRNHALLKSGWAWWYRKHKSTQYLRELEASAKAAHKGLWATPDPMLPWGWRRMRKG